MKHCYFLLVLALCLGSLTGIGQSPTVVTGENLNIGHNRLSLLGLHSLGNAIGNRNVVMSGNVLAVGNGDTIYAGSDYSISLGSFNQLQGLSTMAFGSYLRVNGNRGMAIGSGMAGLRSDEGEVRLLLSNDTANSLIVGFNSTKPTLFVSESPNNFDLNITDRTGRVAIGNVAPTAKLHIRSDYDEDAGIMLEPTDIRQNFTFIHLRDTLHGISVDTVGEMLISAGNYCNLGINSSNYKINEGTATLGASNNTKLFLSSKASPSISTNAKPVNSGYERIAERPSYALELGGDAFRLRTAVYMAPRGDLITNWTTPVTVTPVGAITLVGKVGVNIENTTKEYALAVDGGLITTKVHIQEVADWEDRVFDVDYPLMSLEEIESFVAENKHLPGIPSEAEVKADGFDMAEMQAALLGKIEELVLYTIRQQKEIDSLRDLVTMSFGYDACGNRVSRTLEFSKTEGGRSTMDGGLPNDGAPQWQASLTDNFGNAEAMLFPNPTEGGFFLSMAGDGLPGSTTATLCAVDGTVLEERTAIGVNEEFDLGGRPAGVYLLRLTSGDEMKVWKVVKRK